MTDTAIPTAGTPRVTRLLDIAAKTALVVLLVLALIDPELGNLDNKAAEARAIGYPLASFIIPAVWWLGWRDRTSFPWLPDLLVTSTCFTDILGNRLDLYDTIEWFDDWMHFMNTGLLAAAVVMLTLPATSSLGRSVERALAFGATAAVTWEIAEYFAFIAGSSERQFAYADTLSDLGLGIFGAVLAAWAVHGLWRSGWIDDVEPLQGQRASGL